MSVPSEKRVIAAMNTWRVVKRCSRNPVIGITTAIVSMNAVVSHCACDRGDAEVDDEVRDRHAHRRLVEDRDERGREQQPDDAVLLAAEHRARGHANGASAGDRIRHGHGRLLVSGRGRRPPKWRTINR